MTTDSPVGATACEGYRVGSLEDGMLTDVRVHCPGCAESASLREQLAEALEGNQILQDIREGEIARVLAAKADAAALREQLAAMEATDRVREYTIRSVSTQRDEAVALALTNGEARGMAEAEVARLKDLLDRDRSGLAEGLGKVRKRAIGGGWISQGRGSYAWDDDAYRKETGIMVADIIAIADEHLRDSGRLADEAFHPKLSESLAAAEAERDELRGLMLKLLDNNEGISVRADRFHDVGAWLASHPAIPEAETKPKGTL